MWDSVNAIIRKFIILIQYVNTARDKAMHTTVKLSGVQQTVAANIYREMLQLEINKSKNWKGERGVFFQEIWYIGIIRDCL